MSQKPEKHLPFRPLDNSMSTQTKYELELEHWDRARKSIDNTKSDPGISGVVTLFGGLFQIFVESFKSYYSSLLVLLIYLKDGKKIKMPKENIKDTWKG